MKTIASGPIKSYLRKNSRICALIGTALLALGPLAGAQIVTTNYTTAGNAVWVCPSNVFSIVVKATGGGGAGGSTGEPDYEAAGGGAGGSFVEYTNAVTPGNSYNLTVAAGGVTNTPDTATPGGTGGSSYFGNTSAGTTNGAVVLAVGGAGGVGSGTAEGTGGSSGAHLGGFAGGTASNTGNIPSTGTTGLASNIAGTSGGTSTGGTGTETSGAGGAGAGVSGSNGGGAGGASVTTTGSSNAGNSGTAAGGGGGGSSSATLAKAGGNGARGQVTLIYTAATPSAGNSTETASPASIAADNTTTSTITVTLKDANGDLIAGKTVVIGSSRGAADTILPASTNTSSSGVAIFTIKSGTAGSSTLTATDTTDNVTVTETATVGFASLLIDHFTVTPSTGSANAGQVFSATVQAYSTPGSGSPISDNSVDGTPVIMTSSGLAQFDGSNNGTFANNTMPLTNGTLTINVRDPKAESVTLTATVGSATGTSSSVSIAADAMAQLQVLLPGETSAPGTTTGESGAPTAETAGTGFNITVNAVDTNWNPVTSSDTVQITASGDADVILPANTALSSGTMTLTVTNIMAGSGKTLTASDASNGGITSSTSPSYTVVPGAASQLVIIAPGETVTPGVAPGKTGSPTAQHSTVGYSVTVDALDAYYNLATNSTDTIGITSSVGGDTLPANAALVLGTKTLSLTNNTVGSPTMTASDISNGAVTSGTTTVTVNINATTTTLVSSINPVPEGAPITLTATVSSSASSRTGTVTFKSGAAVVGTSTLSGNTATITTSGGAGTYSITATYNGDGNNSSSTSSPLSQVIQSGPVVGAAALMEDGQDYALSGSTANPPVGRGPWYVSGGTGSTSFIGILAGDLSGATSPDIRPLPNVVNPTTPSKLQVAKAGTNGRWYYRATTNSVSSGSIYFSFLLNVTANPTTTDEFMGTMIPITASNSPVPADPLSLHAREGADTSHFDLGVERLNGTTSWTSDLLTNTTYLVVLKYSFGSSSSNCLYINPTPGAAEPATPAAVAVSDGVTAEPANIGTVLFYEAGTAETYLTTGTYQYDVMRADTTWSTVTPSSTSASVAGASSLAITSSPQTFVVNAGSGLMTVTLEDQSNNVYTATSNIVVNLSSSSLGGSFLSGADDVTVITNVTITAGNSTATFYYNDSLSGSPVITASGGILTSGTQTQTVLPNCTPPTVYTVVGGGAYCSTGNGADVLLSDSQTIATYQLYSNSIAVGSTVTGNGSDIDFGNQLAGTYTVQAYITGDPSCALAMSGSVVSTVNYAANVAGNPTNQNVLAGFTAAFTVSAGDTTSPAYQWQVSTDGGNTYNNIYNGTNATYTTAPTTVGNNSNEFQCVISGSGGCGDTTVTSTPAILAVTKAATSTALASSANPANAGSSITFTATVTGPGVQPTGTVTFYNGAAAIGTGTLSGGVATYSTSGGPSTNSITAVYGGDANNNGSTSSALSQVIQAGAAVAFPAQMQDGQDYAASTSTPETGRGAWQLVENGASATSTSYIYISAGDLSGATIPDINPLPNQTATPPTNPPAHLTVSTAGSEGRYYYRSIGTPATNSTMFFSFLMNVSANPTGSDETRASMLASTASNNPAATDPLTLHVRVGSDSTHYNLGIERLNGTEVWATNSLVDGTNYLIVLEYAFGSSSSDSLYINPTPGDVEPVPSASALSDGVTAEPANIGNVGFWESFDVAPDTTGTVQFDVMRADPSWANATPPVGAFGLGAAALSFSPASQIIQVNQNSALITVTLLNQTNSAYTATTNTLINLSTTSAGGTFRSAADGTTVISSVTISNGTSTATFYYQDTVPGTPAITGANGLLTPAVQTEVVTPNLSRLGYFTVTPSVSSTTVATVFTATVQAYDTNGAPITDDSFNGTPVTMGSSGLAQYDANGDGNYGDDVKDLINGAFTINVRDLKAETITLTAGLGTNVATSSSVSISAGTFVQLQVLLPGETAAPGTATGKSGSPATETAGTGFNITVNAVDTYWNVVASGDTAHTVQSGDADVILPADTALVGGTASLTVTNILTGSGQTLTVSDTSNGSITNDTSTPYTVVAGPAVGLIILAPGETPTFGVAPGKTGSPNAQLQTASFPITVYALDAYYNLVQNNSDTVQITSSDGVATLPANAALTGGTKTFDIKNNTQGTVTDTASDVSNGGVASGSTTLTIDPIQNFRSVQSGDWGSTSTWQYSTDGGVTWTPAVTTPSSSVTALVEITNGITVTVASSVVINRTTVDAGATLAVSSGEILTVVSGSGADLDVFGTVNNVGAVTNNPGASIVFEANSFYNHNQSGGDLPTATWDPSSTCEVTGWTTNTTCSTGMGLGQTLGNFVWNSPSQTANLSLGNSKFTGISGNFEVLSTGSGVLNIVQDGSLSNNIAGNVIVQGGDLDLCKGDGTMNFVVGGNVSVSAGGTLMSTPTSGGAGNMVFSSPITHVFTNSGTINGAVNWIVNSNSTLDMGVSSIGGTNTMTVNPDGSLITAKATGFLGNLAIPATNVNLSTGGNYTYDGTVAQSGDTLLPAAVNGLTVNNSYGVTLAQAETITNLNLESSPITGNISIDNLGTFTVTGASSKVIGNVNMNAGSLVLVSSTNNLPDLTVESGTFNLNSGAVVLTLVGGSPVPQGSYLLVNASGGGSVSGTPPAVATVNGTGTLPALTGVPQIVGTQLYLNVVAFYQGFDAGPGFFGGENIIFTNVSGISYYVWSSSNPSLPLPEWTPEGSMSEFPFGGNGYSRYAINVNPSASPTYYVLGTTNGGPYNLTPIPVVILTTSDYVNFTVNQLNPGVSPDGILNLVPVFASPGEVIAGGEFQFQFTGPSGPYSILSSTNLTTWTVIGTGTIGDGPVIFTDTNAPHMPHQFYMISTP